MITEIKNRFRLFVTVVLAAFAVTTLPGLRASGLTTSQPSDFLIRGMTMNRLIMILAILTIAAFPAVGYPQAVNLDNLFWDNNIGTVSFAPSEEGLTISLSTKLPGNSGMNDVVLVSTKVKFFDANGLEVGSAVVEAPIAGFVSVGIIATDVTETDALLIIEGEPGRRVQVKNHRITLRATASTIKIGRNPQTGEPIHIPAPKYVAFKATVYDSSDGKTHAIDSGYAYSFSIDINSL